MELNRRKILSATASSLSLTTGCVGRLRSGEESSNEFAVQSPVLIEQEPGSTLPYKYSRQGKNISPPLQLSHIPDSARSIAITLRDVTGEDEIVLWLLWGVSASKSRIPQAISKQASPSELKDSTQGTNDHGTIGYSGPDLHRKYESRDANNGETSIEITAYALDSAIELGAEARHHEFIAAINERMRTSTSLYARVQRRIGED